MGFVMLVLQVFLQRWTRLWHNATPDGRKAHTPLAEGCSPAHAMDKKGPTAVFKSVSKLPTHEITGGVLLNQKGNTSVIIERRK